MKSLFLNTKSEKKVILLRTLTYHGFVVSSGTGLHRHVIIISLSVSDLTKGSHHFVELDCYSFTRSVAEMSSQRVDYLTIYGVGEAVAPLPHQNFRRCTQYYFFVNFAQRPSSIQHLALNKNMYIIK